MERKDIKGLGEKCMYMEVEGAEPRKTWLELVKNDEDLASEEALDRHAWRKVVEDKC